MNINLINPNENSGDINKDHGTHVAGIIGATANNEKGITGYVYDNEDLINNGKNTTIADVWVELYRVNDIGTDYLGTRRTDENGKYDFTVDKNGTYTFYF